MSLLQERLEAVPAVQAVQKVQTLKNTSFACSRSGFDRIQLRVKMIP